MLSQKNQQRKVWFSFHFRCAQYSALNLKKYCDLTEKMSCASLNFSAITNGRATFVNKPSREAVSLQASKVQLTSYLKLYITNLSEKCKIHQKEPFTFVEAFVLVVKTLTFTKESQVEFMTCFHDFFPLNICFDFPQN